MRCPLLPPTIIMPLRVGMRHNSRCPHHLLLHHHSSRHTIKRSFAESQGGVSGSASSISGWFAWYSQRLDTHPVSIKCISTGLISSVGNVLAQGITFYQETMDHRHRDQSSLTDNDEDKKAPGECELCDRFIQLTKHHLIPKSTWPRIEPLLLRASEALEQGARDKAESILGPGLLHLVEDLQFATTEANTDNHKQAIRQIMRRTCNICRCCHSAIHKVHDNMDLALHYSTIGQILEDQQMAKFCRMASRHRVGRYAVRNNKKHSLEEEKN